MKSSRAYNPPGTRVRLKPGARTMSGWRGCATMLACERAIMDGRTDWFGLVDAMADQWAKLRCQAPNPEHEALVIEAIGAANTREASA